MMNVLAKENNLCIQETYGIRTSNLYRILNSEDEIYIVDIKKGNKRWRSLSDFFMTVFLPHGYPDSVSTDYLQYQIWDSIQAFASSITGSICTHAILKGAGVGDENASPLAATITWLIKDGTAMLGRITFAWLQGTKLDCDCKKWRLFADVVNDLAMFLDLLSAYFSNHFMLIICFSGLLKSLVGVAGGSTRAALTQHQAKKNNMADVSAKDGSQETLVNLLALICSIILIPVITESFVLTWIMYISMTVVHLVANYFAVRSVIMASFNTARFKIYALQYFCSKDTSKHVLSVEEVNKKENVFFSYKSDKTDIILGSSFKDIIKHRSCKEIKKIVQLYEGCDYMLCLSKMDPSKTVIRIAFNHKAKVLTHMEALYQACFLEYKINNDLENINGENSQLFYESFSRNYTKETFSHFITSVKASGFNINYALFEIDMWRLNW